MIRLTPCPKVYTETQDKARPPAETVQLVTERLAGHGREILARTRRIDTGRLGIPVFISECGSGARQIMPTRKQMGKGASPDQAEASALMELVERYSFFTRWNTSQAFQVATWSEAAARKDSLPLISMERILHSVGEDMDEKRAVRIMDLLQWRFHPATNLSKGREELLPLDWFKTLNEFNGSSAGNTAEESILQGACELVERHVCALADREHPELPTIAPDSCNDPVVCDLLRRFRENGVQVLLKDMSLGLPVPTVAALCHDPATFPGLSEIVFTAGTATTPEKAVVRALTEVAQLAGDFETASVYEASGLPKYTSLDQAAWLYKGGLAPLDNLPHILANDFRDELLALCNGLLEQGFFLYSVDLTAPDLELPAHYNIVPGFAFRERDRYPSLGLFVGRKLAEEAPPSQALEGLEILASLYPEGHFVPFFQGLVQLRLEDCHGAHEQFLAAESLQPDAENQALAAFYAGYSLALMQQWEQAIAHLDRAIAGCDEHKEYYNQRGVALFKLGRYDEAAADFSRALELDRGSVMDLANLGLCYKFSGQASRARECLQSALKLDPALDFARQHLDELES